MASPTYRAYNFASGGGLVIPTFQPTAATVSFRTMLQISPASTTSLRPIAWGYQLSAPPAAPVDVWLVDTGAIAATGLTAHVAAGIQKCNYGGAGLASTVVLGTGNTGFSSAAPTEGTPTATRILDHKREPGAYYLLQSPLGREMEVPGGNFLRVVAAPSSAAAVNLVCWVEWEE